MAFRRHYYSCCSLFLVAMAAMCYSGQGQGQGQGQEQGEGRELLNLNLVITTDMCQRAENQALCRSVVKGVKNPSVAMEAAIRLLMLETNLAKKSVAQRRKSSALDVCFEVYDDAFTNLETCLSNLKTHDKPSLQINLSAALTDYVTCDDAIAERGLTSPVTRTNLKLSQMASNCLYLSTLIR